MFYPIALTFIKECCCKKYEKPPKFQQVKEHLKEHQKMQVPVLNCEPVIIFNVFVLE